MHMHVSSIHMFMLTCTAYGMAGLRSDNGGLPVVQHLVVALVAYLLSQQVCKCTGRAQDCAGA